MPNSQRINVPPPEGNLSISVGEELTIHAARACTFCCSIGGNFSPSLTSVQLVHGNNGPYTAQTAGTGNYNTSDPNTACNPNAGVTLACKSVQINP